MPLIHPLPDIQPCSCLFQFNVPFRFVILFLLQKVYMTLSWVLSLMLAGSCPLLSTHIHKLGEHSSDPRPGLAGEPFLQIGCSLPQNTWMSQDSTAKLKLVHTRVIKEKCFFWDKGGTCKVRWPP